MGAIPTLPDLAKYPLRATKDSRQALGQGLSDIVSSVRATFPKSNKPIGFKAVYDTWAQFNDRAMSSGGKVPAAAILPDRPEYEASSLTPHIIDCTWSGGDPCERDQYGRIRYPIGDGSGDGFALFKTSEIIVPFVLVFRAISPAQRTAFMKRFEEIFNEDGALLPDPSTLNPNLPVFDEEFHPVRYGRIITLEKYYQRKARFTLIAQQTLDTESTAEENRYVGQIELRGETSVCVLRRIRAMRPRIQVVVNGTNDR